MRVGQPNGFGGKPHVDFGVDRARADRRFFSSLIVNRHGEGFLLDIVIGIIGAVIGGFIMSAVGGEGVSGFNLYSILVAIGGAIVLLVILHAIRGTSRTSTY
jgi:uncharacterized membrane protein YeaQ/YmgE (transglycosylase-associated protein family)